MSLFNTVFQAASGSDAVRRHAQERLRNGISCCECHQPIGATEHCELTEAGAKHLDCESRCSVCGLGFGKEEVVSFALPPSTDVRHYGCRGGR
jgi:hypothetical protein